MRQPPPQPPRRRAGKIQPDPPPFAYQDCWLCGARVLSGWGARWGGKYWCWRHHPLRPRFRARKSPTKLVPEASLKPWGLGARHSLLQRSHDTSDRDIERHQRKVDAVLGRKKRKPVKARKRPRDRKYRR